MRRSRQNVLIENLTPNIKRPSEYRRGELAREMLKGFALGGIFVTLFTLPNSAQILTLFETERPRERKRVRRALDSLREQGCIETRMHHGASYYRLTKKGEKRLQKIAIQDIRLPKHDDWDTLWRVIMFDIPNSRKHARDTLVNKLTELGCVQLQKSVYAYPYECRHEILQLAEHLFVRRYVTCLTATAIDNEQRFRKHFRLA